MIKARGFLNELIESVKSRRRDYLYGLMEVSASIALSLALTAAVILALGYSIDAAVAAYSILFSYGFSNVYYLLSRSSPLILTSLAFLFPSLTGLFNIGGEGQLYLGAVTALVVSLYTGNPALSIAAGALAGALHGVLLAALRVYRNVNEVVAAIMMNWALYYAFMFVLPTYLADPAIPHLTYSVPHSAKLPVVELGAFRVSSAFLLALFVAIAGAFLFYRTELGFAMRVSGLNPAASRIAGFDNRKLGVASFALGGAAAGIGGAVLVLGLIHRIDTMMSGLYGYGFLGIGASLLGRNNPVGALIASVFLTGLIIGGQWIETRLGFPHQLADLIVGIIVVSLAIPFAYHYAKAVSKVRRG